MGGDSVSLLSSGALGTLGGETVGGFKGVCEVKFISDGAAAPHRCACQKSPANEPCDIQIRRANRRIPQPCKQQPFQGHGRLRRREDGLAKVSKIGLVVEPLQGTFQCATASP